MQDTEDMKVEEISEPTSSAEIPTTRIHECSDGKQRNEEQYKAYKLKEAQFNKDQDQFIHIDDIVMGVIHTNRGRGCIFGRFNLEETKAALVTIQHRFFNAMTEFDYKMDMKAKEQAIVGADGKPVNKPSTGKIIV